MFVKTQGMHLDPSIYLMDDDNKLLNQMPTKDEESKPSKGDCKDGIKTVCNSTVSQDSQEENKYSCPGNVTLGEETSADQLIKVSGLIKALDILGINPEKKGYSLLLFGTYLSLYFPHRI